MKEKIINITFLIVIILATIFFTRSCSTKPTINNSDDKYNQLVLEHNQLKSKYKQDSITFYSKQNKLTNEISILKTSKNILKEKYINIYKDYKDSPDDTILIPVLITTSNELIEKQDSIILKQDSLIIEQLDYIKKQEIAVLNRDSLLIESNELLNESNMLNKKLDKKLKRTRKIGIGGFFTGIGLGIIIRSI